MRTLFFVSLVNKRILPFLSCIISWQSLTGYCMASALLHLVLMRYRLLPWPKMISSIFDDLKIEGERNIAVAASDDWRMKCFLFICWINYRLCSLINCKYKKYSSHQAF